MVSCRLSVKSRQPSALGAKKLSALSSQLSAFSKTGFDTEAPRGQSPKGETIYSPARECRVRAL